MPHSNILIEKTKMRKVANYVVGVGGGHCGRADALNRMTLYSSLYILVLVGVTSENIL